MPTGMVKDHESQSCLPSRGEFSSTLSLCPYNPRQKLRLIVEGLYPRRDGVCTEGGKVTLATGPASKISLSSVERLSYKSFHRTVSSGSLVKKEC